MAKPFDERCNFPKFTKDTRKVKDCALAGEYCTCDGLATIHNSFWGKSYANQYNYGKSCSKENFIPAQLSNKGTYKCTCLDRADT
jgi:hypothetical protein